MKAPDHPAPSGDRTLARPLFKALRNAGFPPGAAGARPGGRVLWRAAGKAGSRRELAGGWRRGAGVGAAPSEDKRRRGGGPGAARLGAGGRNAPPGVGPRLWFTYHLYYKAPDWI